MWAALALGFLILWLLAAFILNAAGVALHLLLILALAAGAIHFLTRRR
jgi:hypothetical protein